MNIENLLIISVLANFTLGLVIMTTPSAEQITTIINTQIADRLQVIVAEEVGALERSLCRQLNATFEQIEKEKEQCTD